MKKNLLHGAERTVMVVTLETNRPPALSPGQSSAPFLRSHPGLAVAGLESDEHLLVPEIG